MSHNHSVLTSERARASQSVRTRATRDDQSAILIIVLRAIRARIGIVRVPILRVPSLRGAQIDRWCFTAKIAGGLCDVQVMHEYLIHVTHNCLRRRHGGAAHHKYKQTHDLNVIHVLF